MCIILSEEGIIPEAPNKPVVGGKLLRYEFSKDQEYLGEVMDNKAHGHGVLHCRNCVYEGLWDNGMERIGAIINI